MNFRARWLLPSDVEMRMRQLQKPPPIDIPPSGAPSGPAQLPASHSDAARKRERSDAPSASTNRPRYGHPAAHAAVFNSSPRRASPPSAYLSSGDEEASDEERRMYREEQADARRRRLTDAQSYWEQAERPVPSAGLILIEEAPRPLRPHFFDAARSLIAWRLLCAPRKLQNASD